MKLFYLAIFALAAFIAVWIFLVIPAERKHHERKLDLVRKRIEQREAANSSNENSDAGSEFSGNESDRARG